MNDEVAAAASLDPAELPVVAAPRRLFRGVDGPDPLALPPDGPDGPCDDPAGWRSLHLYASRRGALAAAILAAGRSPAAMADLRCEDRRPFLDARDPDALPAQAAALAAAGHWRALAELADEAGLAGVALPVAAAPTQAVFALLDAAAARPLAPPRTLSPHDPDLRALARAAERSDR